MAVFNLTKAQRHGKTTNINKFDKCNQDFINIKCFINVSYLTTARKPPITNAEHAFHEVDEGSLPAIDFYTLIKVCTLPKYKMLGKRTKMASLFQTLLISSQLQ